MLQEHDTSTVEHHSSNIRRIIACNMSLIATMLQSNACRPTEICRRMLFPHLNSAHFFPRLVSCLLRTADVPIPGLAKVKLLEKLRFRLQSSRASKPFILRPSPFRVPLSTIPQLFLPITTLPCRNSNSRMLA